MTVEIKGDTTIIINKGAAKHEAVVLIWTIGNQSIKTSDIDGALEKVYPKRYKKLVANYKEMLI
ncbi:hypothetical protein A2164_00490 [Candidatus Curtissbacteria bacterium RBG_13_35_7]|uniref:Uncharacterized protein n=1 Tax=Candidatus Curtissbacteria bacterium RBG_13_35_7 TaxID=1797705 RepID=A0A1F5G294_9BACT|nr:MAG: hypothetical protein A2164_00490 [Candidatus Curtissbacteria bacterium RBG_13_35_7]